MPQPANSNSDRKKAPYDWLKDFDREARNIQRATDWTEYSYFTLARHPRLQPRSSSRLFDRAGRETFNRTISSWNGKLAEQEGICKGLSQSQQKQLAALVSDTAEGFEKYLNRRKARDWSRTLSREGARRQDMLLRKVEAIRVRLQKLRDYAERLDPSISFSFREAAEHALKCLSEVKTIRNLGVFGRLSAEIREITNDPTTFAMVRIYWFFRTGCRLTGDESEVRTALIRNVFWKPLGIEPVKLRREYKDAESQGCQAVHEAVRRFTKGTSA